MKVSVVVPLYKCSERIAKLCEILDSQTLKDIEFILIDDCSPDETHSTLVTHTQRKERFRIYRMEKNSGPGVCRNYGISIASGEYIGFMDADDYIKPNFYETMYKCAKDNDAYVVKGVCTRVMAHNGKHIESPMLKTLRWKLKQDGDLLNSFNYEHWTGLYQRDFVNQANARYGECRQGEDNIFLMKIMCNLPLDKFQITEDAKYFYNIHSSSISQHHNLSFLSESVLSLKLRIQYLKTRENSQQIQKYIANQFEEKLYYRPLSFWNSPLISRENIYQYFEQVFSEIETWLSTYPNEYLKKYVKLAIDCKYDPVRFCDFISMAVIEDYVQKEYKKVKESISSIHDLKPKLSSINESIYLLNSRGKIFRRYYYEKILTLITWGNFRKTLRERKLETQKLVQKIRHIEKMSDCLLCRDK